MIGRLIAKWQLGKPQAPRKCRACGAVAATCCLPMLGASRFCSICATKIMGQ